MSKSYVKRRRKSVFPWAVVEHAETPGATVVYRAPDFTRAYDWMREHYPLMSELELRVAISYRGGFRWLEKDWG